MSFYVIITMIITLIAKFIGFAREILLSYYFGANSISDAYLISLTIPGTLFQFVGTGLATSFVPIYLKLKKKNQEEESIQFINTVATCILIFSFILCIIVWLFGEKVVLLFASGFSGETLKYAVLFTQINISSLFVSTFVYVFISYLQANGKVLESQISIIPYGIVMLISIILGSKINILLLPIGSIVASIVQLLILIFYIFKDGYKYKISFKVKTKHFEEFLMIIGPVIIGVSINDINILIDKTMASNIVTGAISALSYSYSLTMFIQGVFVQPITNIYYPKITKLVTENKSKEVFKYIDEALICMMYFLFPITVYSMISSKNIVGLLYGRGAFDATAIQLTAKAFLGYSISFIGIGCRELFSRIFYANNDTKMPTINAAIGGMLNIVLNVILSRYFGLFGLTLSTSLSACITVILLYYSLLKRNIYIINKKLILQLLKIIFASVLMGSAILIIRFINSNALLFMIELLVGGIIYLFVTYLFKIHIITIFIDNIQNKFFKKQYENL